MATYLARVSVQTAFNDTALQLFILLNYQDKILFIVTLYNLLNNNNYNKTTK